jgi:type I restriction enzyme S subunit
MPRYKFEDIAINSKAKKKPTEADKDTYLGLEHLDSDSLTVTRFGSEVAPIGEKLLMRKGDVLFGKRRAYQKKVAIAPFDGIFSAHGMVLRPNTNAVTERFFPLFIASDYFLDAAIKISVGSLSPTINWSALKELEFDLPPLDEQDPLAEVLWAMIDTKNAYKRLISLTDDLVKSRFVEMFGGREFDTKRLGEVVRVRSSKRVYQKEQTNYGVPFLRVSDLTDRITNGANACELYIADELYDSFAQSGLVPTAGDILVTSRGTLGLCYIIREADRFYFQDGMISWLDKSQCNIDSVYIAYLFQTDLVKKQIAQVSGGSTVAYISLSNLENFKIPLPPLELQTRFAAFAEAADKSKFALKCALQKLESMYKALLQQKLG